TFTASQGLLLMIPNMYKLAGEQTPAVFHVAARAIATHALSIFGDHSDIYACRQTGFVMLASNNVQQVMDLSAVAHLSAIAGRLPVLHFFDGFRTSHESQKIEIWDYDELEEMVDKDAIIEYRKRALSPCHPHSMGSAEQPESFFQHREACNPVYANAADLIAKYMDLINEKTGSDYKPFNYYGAPDAEEIIVAMGSVCDTAEEVVDYLASKGKKAGLVKVHLYRPFSVKYLLNVLPETTKKIAVLDRTKEPGSIGEPLFLDVCAALRGTKFENVLVTGGRYGLGSKDTRPEDILAVYENLWSSAPKREFTISINDDVTGLSLHASEIPHTAHPSTVSCKFWGLGSDGTVGANKNSIKIIGDHTDKKVQAYFQYDSKKSGGVTISHLRFGDAPIRAPYYIHHAHFVACHEAAYIGRYKMAEEVLPGGVFLLNCPWTDEELNEHLPGRVKRYIAQNDIRFYTCDAVEISQSIGLGAQHINTVLQAAFFRLADIMPIDDAVRYMKERILKSYGKNGEKVVNMNYAAVDAGINNIHKVEIPANWANAPDSPAPAAFVGRDEKQSAYLNNILAPYAAMEGDSIPVSAFVDSAAGGVPAGLAAYEKRGTAVNIPEWISENCMQCNLCAGVCPHSVIRPYAIEKNAENIPGERIPMKGSADRDFAIGISALDCTGCGSCVEVCPARKKALKMIPAETDVVEKSQKRYDILSALPEAYNMPFVSDTFKGIQFKKPLLEFPGACPGCGETPYAKLLTQLFGERMYIANATGCSSIWGNSLPSTPYTMNENGRGPAWANSLFEDNAEFGLGMALSVKARRNEMRTRVERLSSDPSLMIPARAWLSAMNDPKNSEFTGNALLKACEPLAASNPDAAYVLKNYEMLQKPSVWIFGGDGWAYDIGYGGLDHVIASGENVNIIVFDTEVYSNTGGQSSKSTPMGAVAKFAASGKTFGKKNLAKIAISYGYVYVAQIALGANPAQTTKAMLEAESYDGPSLIIAYAPCIAHGLKAGMSRSIEEMMHAVRSGYWHLFRFDPRSTLLGKNPLTLDSPPPTESFREFIAGEVRYDALRLKYPEKAEEIFAAADIASKKSREELVRLRESFEPEK
ncbi:MAG: pyruvate:ferredoxin (flavodoxin) oxidoreductase, partial [Firmicutes bacterium]|nr:pyruvate:ferredoxin (flavodoxin) oxidoreductase [Bacillota bacterium]